MHRSFLLFPLSLSLSLFICPFTSPHITYTPISESVHLDLIIRNRIVSDFKSNRQSFAMDIPYSVILYILLRLPLFLYIQLYSFYGAL